MKRMTALIVGCLAVLPGRSAIGKETVDEAFLSAVRSAGVVAVAVVKSAQVTQDEMKWYPPSWTESVALRWERPIFGKPGADGRSVRVHATPYRGMVRPKSRFKADQHVLVAGRFEDGTLRGRPALTPWSAETERAVREALAP